MRLNKDKMVHLGNPLALHGLLLELAEVVVVCHHVGDDGLLVRRVHEHVLCTQENLTVIPNYFT